MTKILAIDACTEACSVALQLGDETLVEFEVCPQQHSQKLLPMVDALLARASVSLNQLDAIAFGRGPGSFTGVRIGISAVQGLAFGADIGTFGVSTLQMLAQGGKRLHDKGQVVAAIDARMGEIYTASYQEDASGLMRLVGEESVVKPELFAPVITQGLGVGTGWATYPELGEGFEVSELVTLPNAQDCLGFAQEAIAGGKLLPAEDAQPVYVRDTVTWKKLPGRE